MLLAPDSVYYTISDVLTDEGEQSQPKESMSLLRIPREGVSVISQVNHSNAWQPSSLGNNSLCKALIIKLCLICFSFFHWSYSW